MDAKTAWEELEAKTGGTITPIAVLCYIAENADEDWVATFARMAVLVGVTNSWE